MSSNFYLISDNIIILQYFNDSDLEKKLVTLATLAELKSVQKG